MRGKSRKWPTAERQYEESQEEAGVRDDKEVMEQLRNNVLQIVYGYIGSQVRKDARLLIEGAGWWNV